METINPTQSKIITPAYTARNPEQTAIFQLGIIQACYGGTYPTKEITGLRNEIESRDQLLFFLWPEGQFVPTATTALMRRGSGVYEVGRTAKIPGSPSAGELIFVRYNPLFTDESSVNAIWSWNRAEPDKTVNGNKISGGAGIHFALHKAIQRHEEIENNPHLVFCGILPLYIGQDGRSEPFSQIWVLNQETLHDIRKRVKENAIFLPEEQQAQDFVTQWFAANLPEAEYKISNERMQPKETILPEPETIGNSEILTVDLFSEGSSQLLGMALEEGFIPLAIIPPIGDKLEIKLVRMKPNSHLIMPFEGITNAVFDRHKGLVSTVLGNLEAIDS